MYYLQSRYYDPAICRFINADAYLINSLLGYNQFAYCENNPVTRVDFTGTNFDYIDFGYDYDVLDDPDHFGGGCSGSLSWESTYNSYLINQHTAYTDAMANGWYHSGMSSTYGNFGYYNVCGPYSVTDDMAIKHTSSSISKTQKRGWKLGDDIRNPTKDGKIPNWNTVRQRFWKNEARNNPSRYTPEDLKRMRQGLAPIVNGKPMELHHPYGRSGKNFFVFKPLTYQDHFFTHYGRYP